MFGRCALKVTAEKPMSGVTSRGALPVPYFLLFCAGATGFFALRG
jgi:hypothetical protein